MSRCHSVWIGAVAFLLIIAGSQLRAEIVDRVAAVVNTRVITLSDVHWSFIDGRQPLPDDPAERSRVMMARLNQLIEQELVVQEAEKEVPLAIEPGQVDSERAKLAARYGGAEMLEAEAKRSGLPAEQLQAIVRRQLTVLRFIDVRFRPFIIVSQEEVAAYYRETLVQELKKQGIASLPPLDEVAGQIEKLVAEQKVDQELEKWLSNARKRAKITVLLGRDQSPNTPPEEWLEKTERRMR